MKLPNAAKLVAFAMLAFMVIFLVLLVPSAQQHLPSRGGNKAAAPTESPDAVADKIVNEFFASMDAATLCPVARKWSVEELRQHSDRQHLLIVVHGLVLNVTDFLPHHPGGDAILRASGGVDGDALFAQFHSPSTTNMFRNFCVGHATVKRA